MYVKEYRCPCGFVSSSRAEAEAHGDGGAHACGTFVRAA